MQQIWAKDIRDEKNVALVFTYAFTPKKGDELRVACNTAFRLTVNGALTGYGPRRMAHGKAAVNTYSLSAYAGECVRIEIEAVSYRVTNFYIINQEPFFAAEILSDGESIANSSDFAAYRNESKLQKVQRYSYTRGFIEAYRIDGTRKLTKVQTDEREVCALCECAAPYPVFRPLCALPIEYGKVFERETYTEYDDAYINRRNTPHFSREEQEYRISAACDALRFVRTKEKADELCRSYTTYKLPYNATGFISFEAQVLQDADLTVQFDEILSDGEDNINMYRTDSINAVNYKLTKGNYTLTTFEPNSMQYVRFAALQGKVTVNNVRLITYENGEVTARLHTDDPELDLLFAAAVHSFAPNAVDILTDCPSRERAGWLCDSYFTGRAEYALTGANKAEKNLLQAYLDMPAGAANIPAEVFPMCYPADHIAPGRYIPNWCMWLILELESYLSRSGDRELIDAFRDKVCKFSDYMLRFTNADGLIEDPDGWVFVEWSKANELTAGVNYPTNMLFCAALKAASRLYGMEKYARIAQRADEAIVRQSYDGKFFRDRAVRSESGALKVCDEYTETCQYYAFTFGYASQEKTPALYKILFDELSGYDDVSEKYPLLARSNSFIGLYLRLDYLCAIGEYDRLLRDIKKYFLFQAKETKTFWEYKDARGSCCHGFASVIGEWLIKAVKRL